MKDLLESGSKNFLSLFSTIQLCNFYRPSFVPRMALPSPRNSSLLKYFVGYFQRKKGKRQIRTNVPPPLFNLFFNIWLISELVISGAGEWSRREGREIKLIRVISRERSVNCESEGLPRISDAGVDLGVGNNGKGVAGETPLPARRRDFR